MLFMRACSDCMAAGESLISFGILPWTTACMNASLPRAMKSSFDSVDGSTFELPLADELFEDELFEDELFEEDVGLSSGLVTSLVDDDDAVPALEGSLGWAEAPAPPAAPPPARL